MSKTFFREWEGRKIKTVWREPNEKLSGPITQATGFCFTSDNRILIIRKPGRAWHLPGGHPEDGESLIQTIKREVMEEASVELSDCHLIGYSEVFYPENPDEIEGEHYYQARLACKIKKINKLRTDPATGILFERKLVTPQEFLELIKWPDAKFLLEKSLKKIKEN